MGTTTTLIGMGFDTGAALCADRGVGKSPSNTSVRKKRSRHRAITSPAASSCYAVGRARSVYNMTEKVRFRRLCAGLSVALIFPAILCAQRQSRPRASAPNKNSAEEQTERSLQVAKENPL